MRTMSLRQSLISVIAGGMAVSLLLACVVAAIGASRRVQTELHAALAVAMGAAETALAAGSLRSDAVGELKSLIAAFEGNRHVRLSLSGNGATTGPLPSDDTAFGTVPAVFARLIVPTPPSARVVFALGNGRTETLTIEADPSNELGEVWEAFCIAALTLLVFGTVTVGAIHVLVGRALRPLDELGEALRAVGRGDFTTQQERPMAPELAGLYRGFNDMTLKLKEAKAENLRLGEKLVTLQEAERREIARDLHDEFGPFLFAVNVDAATIVRHARSGRTDEIPAAVQGITEAVSHMQEQVRSMLGRLRPAGLDEFGLAATLEDLVAFWRRRRPGIDYRLEVDPAVEGLGDVIETTIYRIAQEGLSNAVRHGSPATVDVRVRLEETGATGGTVVVEVVDDGIGLTEARTGGFGLLGMGERVQSLGGSLTSADRPEGGFLVRASLPLAAPVGAAARNPAAREGREGSVAA